MKITLILLSYLVAISCQQRIGWNSPFNPRFGYSPYYYVYAGMPNDELYVQSEVRSARLLSGLLKRLNVLKNTILLFAK
jgi:hypothetical protein